MLSRSEVNVPERESLCPSNERSTADPRRWLRVSTREPAGRGEQQKKRLENEEKGTKGSADRAATALISGYRRTF